MVQWGKQLTLLIVILCLTQVVSQRDRFRVFDKLTSASLARASPLTPTQVDSATRPAEDWRAPITILRGQRQEKVISFYKNRTHSNKEINTPLAAAADSETSPIAAIPNTENRSVKGSCTSSADVHTLLDDIVCSKSYLQALITASKKCNLFGYFDSDHIRGCGVDANGTYCRKHERKFPDPDYLAWEVLQKCSLQTQSSSCSSSCKSSLSTFAAKFGCCIYVSRASWFLEDNPHILILSSALWTFCGLKRPKPCRNVPKLPSSTIAGSCTYGCYAYARSALICERVGSQLIETYTKCGRKGSAAELGQLCGINNKGMACFELQFSDNTDYLLSIYTACFEYFSSGTCARSCSSALKHFRGKYGCCVNVYNGTAFGDSSQLLGSILTNHALWSRCGVESPGMCSLPSSEEMSGNQTTYNVQAFCDGILTDGVPHLSLHSTNYCILLLMIILNTFL